MRWTGKLAVAGGLALCACLGVAQEAASSGGAAERSELRVYLDERWLLGSPQRMLEEADRTLALAPLRAVELAQKSSLSEETKRQIVSGVQAARTEVGAKPLTAAQVQEQYQLLGDCMEREMAASMPPEKLVALKAYANSGVYRRLGGLKKQVEDWLFVAYKRQTGTGRARYTAQSMDAMTKEPGRSERQSRLFSAYLVISDGSVGMLAIHNFLGAGVYRAVMGELSFMSEDLPGLARSQGLLDAEWLAVERYAADDGVYLYEFERVEKCLKSESVWTNAYKKHLADSLAAMERFFERNPGLLEPAQ